MFEESSKVSDVNDRYTSPEARSHSGQNRGSELLTITVEIGNGQKENIVIYENDDAQQISDAFCEKHNINEDLKVVFTNQITENIIQVKREIANETAYANKQEENKSESCSQISPPSIEQPLFSDV